MPTPTSTPAAITTDPSDLLAVGRGHPPPANLGHPGPHDDSDIRLGVDVRSAIKARTPPPAYDVLPPPIFPQLQQSGGRPGGGASGFGGHGHGFGQPQAQPHGPSSPYAQFNTHPHTHPAFGPTPISSTLPLLPYAYIEAPGAADRRARWRFVSALVVGMGLYVLVGMAVGLEVVGERGIGGRAANVW